MIWVFKLDRASAFSCETNAEFFQHINAIENAKLLEDSPAFGQTAWSFIYYSPKRVANLYTHTQQTRRSPILNQAYERNLGFMEICTGNFENPREVLLTADVDVNDLKKQWCLDYCDAHDYNVVEQGAAEGPNKRPVKGFFNPDFDYEVSPSEHSLTDVVHGYAKDTIGMPRN